jgi:hypothetical protein
MLTTICFGTFSSYLLSKNVNIKIYNNITFLLYRCGTRSLTIKEEQNMLRLLENIWT